MNSGITTHQQRGHTETGPRFKVSSERQVKREIELALPGLVVQRVIHHTTAAPGYPKTVTVNNMFYLIGTIYKSLHECLRLMDGRTAPRSAAMDTFR